MRLNEILAEKYLEGARAPLYHWTALSSLFDILKLGALGQVDDWHPIEGAESLKKGWVSFTRDKNYRIRGSGKHGSNIRLSFDFEKLKQKGYKIEPYVDRSVVGNLHDEDPLPQRDARWEAEEVILGPVKLKDGLIKIEADKDAIDEIKKHIKIFQEYADKAGKTAQELEDGTFKWSLKYWATGKPKNQLFMHKKFIAKAKAELKKDPNWKPPRFTVEAFRNSEKNWLKTVKKWQDCLDAVQPLS
jgi:hypothetical protein